MSGRSNISPPQPHRTISCQQLLQEDISFSGWLRKPSKLHKSFKLVAKVIPWLNKYSALSKGCMYIFDSDTAKKPSSAFTLYGYDGVNRAGEILQDDAPWAFKLVAVDGDPKRLRYFSASSEREQKVWMTSIKKQMMFANGKGSRVSKKSYSSNEDNVSFNEIEERVYDTTSVINIGPVDDLDDEHDEDYNEIDEWEGDGNSRHSRPLPPLPPGDHGPSVRPAKGNSRERNHSASQPNSPTDRREPSFPPKREPAPLPGQQPVAAPPPIVGRRKPPELPRQPPEDGIMNDTNDYLDQHRTAVEECNETATHSPVRQSSSAVVGTVGALAAKFNDKPITSPKPNLVGLVKVIPQGGVPLKPPFSKKSEAVLKKRMSEEESVLEDFTRKALPLPTNDRLPQPLHAVRGGPDGMADPVMAKEHTVFWHGRDKDEANRMLNEIGEDGVFLVRSSGEREEQVLVVFAEGGSRKYKIHNDGMVYITSDEQFSSLNEMLDYYCNHDLPRRKTALTQPYSAYRS